MEIVYEDEYVLLADKPAGLATQSASVGARDLESELKKYRKRKGEPPEVYIINRLDQPVSGLVLTAKDKKSAAVLSKFMQDDELSKDYKALAYKTEGTDIPKEGTLRDYLVKDGTTNTSRVVSKNEKNAKEAVLDYKITAEKDSFYEVKIHLHTGRHHQIRVQFANLGIPLLGDLKYGTEDSIGYSKSSNIKNVALRAYRLSFKHPVNGKVLEFEKDDLGV